MLRFWYGVVCIGIDIGNPGQGILADFIPSNGEYIYSLLFPFVLFWLYYELYSIFRILDLISRLLVSFFSFATLSSSTG